VSTTVIMYVLTALAAVVVVLTRLRLGPSVAAGRASTARGLLNVHTVVGGLAVVSWTAFLIAPEDVFLGTSAFGIVALGCWWVTALAGILILFRWRKPRGRHASVDLSDAWSRGPWLSLLAHLGMVVGVGAFTWAYLTSLV
jgi:hypothetical protein